MSKDYKIPPEGSGPEEFHAIKWLTPDKATRFTREVSITATIEKTITDCPLKITVLGYGDCEHHLVEDTSILLKKMAQVKCGDGHGA